ncbi:MAG: hypothetical protein JWQ50_2827 [Caballeronia mineralivorans]|jgi:hypothetical protein|nr:hypothetical protein [Caballeronia mineralivorans]
MRCINSIPASVTEVVLKRLKPSRFDDPRMSLPQDHRCGTCYFGQSLRCAFAETVLHDEGLNPQSGMYEIAPQELNRFILTFKEADPLMLADMIGVFSRLTSFSNMLKLTILPIMSHTAHRMMISRSMPVKFGWFLDADDFDIARALGV